MVLPWSVKKGDRMANITIAKDEEGTMINVVIAKK